MNQRKEYKIYEGSFLTETPAFDQSVNILRFVDPEEREYTVLVNRAYLTKEQTLEEFCEAQMTFMENTIPGFSTEGKQLKSEIGPAKLSVVQIANRFLQDGKLMKQVQSFVSLPYHEVNNPAKINLIIFTLTTEEEFTDYQRKHYVQIINSFNPEVTELKK